MVINVEVIKSPIPEDIESIVAGVVSYGKSQVSDVPQKRVFCVKEKGEVIGGIVGSIQCKRFYLSHLWVHEKYRGKGIGSQLLISCESALKQEFCTSIILETLNPQVRRLYINQGYIEVGCIKDYVQGFDLVHLLKDI